MKTTKKRVMKNPTAKFPAPQHNSWLKETLHFWTSHFVLPLPTGWLWRRPMVLQRAPKSCTDLCWNVVCNIPNKVPQLVERRTGIARSRVQAPLKSWIFFRLLYAIVKIAIITARIILHLISYPQFTYDLFHMHHSLTYLSREHMNPKLTCSQRQWLHSSVSRTSHRYREVTGSSPVEVLNFFQASLRNCKNCDHNCEDHSSFDNIPRRKAESRARAKVHVLRKGQED